MVKRIDIRGDGSWNESPTGAWVSSREYDKLEAALRKVDEWFYPGDSDLPHEVALMNEVHRLVTATGEAKE